MLARVYYVASLAIRPTPRAPLNGLELTLAGVGLQMTSAGPYASTIDGYGVMPTANDLNATVWLHLAGDLVSQGCN